MQTMPSKPNHFKMHVKQSLCWFYACAFPAAIDATNFWHSLKYFFDIFPWIKCTLKKFSWYPWLTVNAFDTQFAKIEFEYPGKSTYLCSNRNHQQHQHTTGSGSEVKRKTVKLCSATTVQNGSKRLTLLCTSCLLMDMTLTLKILQYKNTIIMHGI